MKIDGNCHCGAIAFEADVDPQTLSVCHCTDCQMLTGTAFRASIQAPAAGFKLLRGHPRQYLKTAESGAKRLHAFCGECGTPVYACAPENPGRYSLRAGTIAQRATFSVARQIWCRSAAPWLATLAAAPSFEKG